MVGDKQVQKAGDNSQQIQANNIIITNGIEEKRAREIFMEMFDVARKDLTNEAYVVATQRVIEFENDLIPKIQKIDGAMSAFSNPDFQFLLTNAHKTAAATERPSDYSLLSELLIHRIQKGNNRQIRAGISRAVEIVDEISDEALLGLTVAFAVEKYYPSSGEIFQGLDTLNDLFGKLCYGTLPLNNDWLDHLDILDAIRMSTFGTLKKYDEYYSEKMSGYCVVGIKRNSENYTKSIEMLRKVALPENALVDNGLNEEYVRICVVNEENIENCQLIRQVDIGGTSRSLPIVLTEEQKQTLHQIYAMYENDDNLMQDIKKRFCDELIKRPYLNLVREWWDKIPVAFNITAVGRVLAHASAKRNDDSIPDLPDLRDLSVL